MNFVPNERISGLRTTYTIIKSLDNGSQGYVYQVKGDDEKFYALKKVLHMKQSEINFLQIYFLKQQIFSCLLIQYEYFIHNNYLVIIQEYCSGGNLYQILQKQKLQQQEIQRILLDICRQLQVLRAECFFHRDLKPENILIQKDPITGRNQYKLCDFGEIKEIQQNSNINFTQNQMLKTMNVGTPYYQAPEVIQSQIYDDSADIWSLGTLIYELYTNQPLFNGRTLQEIQAQILSSVYDEQAIHKKIDEIQTEIKYKNLIKQMLSYNSKDRPSLENIQKVYSIEQAIDFERTISQIKIKSDNQIISQKQIEQNKPLYFQNDNKNLNKQKFKFQIPLQYAQFQHDNKGHQFDFQQNPQNIYQQNYKNFMQLQQNQGNQYKYQNQNPTSEIQDYNQYQKYQAMNQNQTNSQIPYGFPSPSQKFNFNPEIQHNFKEKQNNQWQNSDQTQQKNQFNLQQGQFEKQENKQQYKPDEKVFQNPYNFKNPWVDQNSFNFQQKTFINPQETKLKQNTIKNNIEQQQEQIIKFNQTNNQEYQSNQNVQRQQEQIEIIAAPSKDIEKNNQQELIEQQQQKLIQNEENIQQQNRINQINNKIKEKFNIPEEIVLIKNENDLTNPEYAERIRNFLLQQYENIKLQKDSRKYEINI